MLWAILSQALYSCINMIYLHNLSIQGVSMNKIDKTWFAGNFIEEVEPKITIGKKRKHKRRQVKLKCLECGKEFIVDLSNAKRVKQKYCSRQCSAKQTYKIEGGNENHPLYTRWLSMLQRCNNKNNKNYKNYGGRGIIYHKDFNDFVKYVNYVTSLPNYDKNKLNVLSLDRVNNNGNYTYGNLRWTNRSIQTINQRKKKSSNTYKGISLNTTKTKWVARVTYKSNTINIGTYNTEKEALEARNKYIIDNKLPHEIQEYKEGATTIL